LITAKYYTELIHTNIILKIKLLALFKKLEKSEKYSFFGIIGITVILIIGVVLGLWDLNSDILTQVPSNVLFNSMIGLVLFGFRERIVSKLIHLHVYYIRNS
jgi:hypothetical protein